MPVTPLSSTERTTVRRLPERSRSERAELYAVLDEGIVCHVGFVTDRGPVVIPTAYCRIDDQLFMHGSPASYMLRNLEKGIDVCVSVTLIDGIVLARSAFHHSMNYRSAVVFGQAEVVKDLDTKASVLDSFVDHVLPGRSGESRSGNEKELRGTRVLALSLDEASVKVRSGPPVDDDEDMALGHWAGVIPIGLRVGTPIPDDLSEGPPPSSLTGFIARRGAGPCV